MIINFELLSIIEVNIILFIDKYYFTDAVATTTLTNWDLTELSYTYSGPSIKTVALHMHWTELTTENKDVRILWDFSIQTDRYVNAHKPRIILKYFKE